MFPQQIAELKLLILNGDKKYLSVLEKASEMASFDLKTYAGVLQIVAQEGIKKESFSFYEKAVLALPQECRATYISLAKLYSNDFEKDEQLLKKLSSDELMFLGDDISIDVYNKCLYHSFFIVNTDIVDAFVTKLNKAGEKHAINN